MHKILAFFCIVFLASHFNLEAQIIPFSFDSTQIILVVTETGDSSYIADSEIYYGYKNNQGKILIPPMFMIAEPFSEGLAYVSSGRYFETRKTGYIDVYGKFIITLPDSLDSFKNDDIWYCNPDHRFSEGLAAVYHKGLKKYGYINKQLKIIIPFQFDLVGKFSESVAFAGILGNSFTGQLASGTGDRKDKIGYIDKTGKFILLLHNNETNLENGCYYCGSPFKNGIADLQLVENGNDCGNSPYYKNSIDKTGQFVDMSKK